ncbi:BaiN/RdsA family NAD(P)/FAD-dependent oxidoreductase [Rhodobacter maris]|uniref:NAD(P)/FAD-dependent oxidoreductase n=1 Tax=Rhodobacter maris TaxID=446682 RepID=A0A285SCP5_9RHOB|nr:NAD(P)/FAD-dependent oxidoreductase [Rhodobacter maris]SOC05505.1 hypothetical protein SAMN05877831_104170 [Rhodobacter maris]
MSTFDAIILGAGAAGLFCGVEAAARGRRVVVLDHAARPGEKIRISGGGRCNFTNQSLTRQNAPERFLSENPRFALSALSRFTARDMIARIEAAGIPWHEKHSGQLFFDGKAHRLVEHFCAALPEGALRLGVAVEAVDRAAEGFVVRTSEGELRAPRVIVATGGKSIPKIGASGLGYKIAESFGLRVTETRPGLVPLTFAEQDLARTAPLAGISLPARVRVAKRVFDEALLFTHRGLSGPAILQASSYWQPGEGLTIDLAPGRDLVAELAAIRAETGRIAVQTALARLLPEKLAQVLVAESGVSGRLADLSNRALGPLVSRAQDWQIRPVGSEGYRTAEVTVGGVATEALDAKTLEAKAIPGLHFIGEVVDVTGWLGGYNFQWAWSSAWAAAQVI